MSVVGVFLVFLLLVGLFGLVNLWANRKREAAFQAWLKENLPEGTRLEDFLEAAPYGYRLLLDRRAYGIWDKRKSDDTPVNTAKTEEEAQAWIVAATLNEQRNPP
ncbi:MAG TPA: hypothetical protein VFS50_04175 [Meiothermus sp.]|jgi:hypothetical protein|nr:hypothetical protein [Meiothermus sp.]